MDIDELELEALSGGELGHDEILGDMQEILGQGGNSMPSERKRLVSVSDGPWKLKLFGHRTAAVAAGATQAVEIRPPQNYKVARIIFASEIAPFFGITVLSVGPEQMLLGGEVPASALSEGSLGAALRLRTINVGVPLNISCINRDAAAQDLKFALIGIAMS